MLTFIVRYGYVPFVLLGINGAAIALAASGAPKWSLVALILFAVVCSFAAERALPYESSWNAPGPDRFRDAVHAFVYESLILVSVAVIPLMAAVIPFDGLWPNGLPFVVQVVFAVLVADFGITVVHLISHRVGWLWRFHAVHHSLERF